VNDDLPEGWVASSLGDCVDVLDSRRVPVNSEERVKRPGSVPYYGATGQVGWIDGHLFDEELVLLGEDGAPFLDKSKAIAYIIDGKSWVNNHAHVLRAKPSITTNKFVKLVLDSTPFDEYVNGTTRLKLTQGAMVRIPIRLPPLPEQRRIVSKVETLLARVNTVRERLEKVPLLLKRFRQAVLAAACSGRLTESWRKHHQTVKPAADVLKTIATERVRVGSKIKDADDEGIEMPELELPERWARCRVCDIADVRLGGTPSRKVAGYWRGDFPWVSSGEVANCRIRSTTECITQEGLENSNAKLYPAGTVLIAMIGEGKTRGQAALLEIEACTNQNSAGLVFDAGNVNPEYIWYWALSEYEKNRDVGRGGNQPALNGGKVRALPVPLPPLDEQHQIVRAVRRLLDLADATERRVAVAAARTNKMPQSILARAFAGELVPTEAELAAAEERAFESAEELLHRVAGSASRQPTEVAVPRAKQRGRPRRAIGQSA